MNASVEICANCEAPLEQVPIYEHGMPFCCSGCADGGPCRCTYGSAPTRASFGSGAPNGAGAIAGDLAAPAAPPAPPASAKSTTVPATGDDEVRVGSGARSLILRVGPFADQTSMLGFAREVESNARVQALSLVRGSDLDDVWFDALLGSPEELEAAILDVAGRAVQRVVAAPGGVEVALRAQPDEDGADDGELLPPRHRARISTPQLLVRPEPVAPAPRPEAAMPDRPASSVVAEAVSLPPEPDAAQRVGADERPGGAAPLVEHVTLIVYPFRSFARLNDFQGAVRELRGVRGTRVRRFYRGTLHLQVEFEDVIPLVQRLGDIHSFQWEMVAESRGEIEIRLVADATLTAPDAPVQALDG